MKYFSEQEFKNCIPSCSIEDMDKEFLELLDELREQAGIPLILNCAYRSKEWDLKKGRSGNSSHTKGKAVDIKCTNSNSCYKIIKAALELNIKRIGVGKNYIHIDNDGSLPQEVIWNYY